MSPTTPPPSANPPARRPQDDDEAERAEARRQDAFGWTIVGHMAAAIAVYGGIGYLLGRWTGHPILLLFGILFGTAVSLAYTVYTASREQRQK
jgi:F0F1-type ATP synthase assembly protein I